MIEAPRELEGRLHPLAVLVIARRFIGASLLPMLALIVSAGVRVVLPIALVLLLVGVPLAVLSWWRFRYRVGDGKLELHSGVFSRSVRTIPLDRIRGVDVTEPFIHRLLGLVKVDVEAAAGGRSKAELSLAAVSREQADQLREAVLAGPRGAAGEEAAEAQPVYRATPGLLVLGGLTSMRYLLAPAAVVGVVFNLADDLPGGIVDRATDAAADRFPTDALGIVLVVALGIGLVVLAAIAGSLLVDWRFTVRDEGERLAASRGLLTRRVVHLDRDRIRGADVRDSPLRRPLGLSSVNAIAAGLRGRTGGTALAPVIHNAELPRLLQAVDPEAPEPAAALVAHPAASRRRRLVRALALPLLGARDPGRSGRPLGRARGGGGDRAGPAGRAGPPPSARPPLRRAPPRPAGGKPPASLVGARSRRRGRVRSEQLARSAPRGRVHADAPSGAGRRLPPRARPRRRAGDRAAGAGQAAALRAARRPRED